MKINILTLFPDYFASPFSSSLLKKGLDKNIMEINIVNIRDFSKNKHHKVDDYPYGGGCGMLMEASPIIEAYESISNDINHKCIYLSPQGKLLNQEILFDLSQLSEITLVCGHYEGIDERVLDLIVDEEISIGDYVLSGGEPGAVVFTDALSRTIDGIIGKTESVLTDSLIGNLLKYPQYTRPSIYRGLEVPKVLLSGHHKNIEKWKKEKSIQITKEKRPDLWAKYLKGR